MDDLSYDHPGATAPASPDWPATPAAYRRSETTVRLGTGDALWADASRTVLRWGVKTRSGFAVRAEDGGHVRAREGVDYTITARLGPLRITEPARVVAVVDEADRCGFAYGTRPGHPVAGEEAFVVHRDPDGAVHLTLRSLTRPAPSGPWRPVFGVLLLAQRVYRRRYRRALVPRRHAGPEHGRTTDR